MKDIAPSIEDDSDLGNIHSMASLGGRGAWRRRVFSGAAVNLVLNCVIFLRHSTYWIGL